MSDDEEPELSPDPANDETPDATDPKQQRRVTRKRRVKARKASDLWRAVLSEPVLRAELWMWITEDLGAFRDEFKCGPNGFPQSEATWFRAGQKAVGLKFYMDRQVDCMDLLMLMHQENDARMAAL